MNCPIMSAVQVSLYYFGLNQNPFDDALDENISFSVEAEICESELPPKHFEASFEGKYTVVDVFKAKHFLVTMNIYLEKLDFEELAKDRVKVTFVSVETKMEDHKHKTYNYTGHFEIVFTKEMKVRKIVLKNRRELLSIS